MKDVTEQAFPLECGTLDVATTDGFGFFFQSAHSTVPMQRQGLAGSLAESWAQASLEIALMVHMALPFPRHSRQSMARAIREI